MVKLFHSQLERGARFLHERPASATSWQDPCMARLLNEPRVESGVGHVCRFEMRVSELASAGVGGRLVR
eukprot:11670264-Alexandrium_andersonii.AAC.1